MPVCLFSLPQLFGRSHMRRRLVPLFLFVLSSISSLLAQQQQIPDDTPIPEIPKKLRPEEVIKADTMPKPVNVHIDSLPGGSRTEYYPYSPSQDTTFFRALRLKINPSLRFSFDAQRALSNLEIVRRKLQESPWQLALRNMTVPDEAYRPDPRESVNRQVAIEKAMDGGLYRPNSTGGFTATFSEIGSVLGLTEDTSPRLRYEVKDVSQVVVVVYSTAATIVATVLKKVQQPGQYSVSWNLRDDKMREMPEGDYVMEARVGEGLLFRKRVVIGSK